MKKIKNIPFIAFFAVIFALGAFSSCNEDLTLKSLPYLFRPVNFNVSLYKTIATITWTPVDSAKSYTLQLSTDSLFGTRLIDTTTTKLLFIKELAGQTKFFARIRTNASDTTKNSKFNATLSFTTPKENIFLGYGTKNNTGNIYSAYMDSIHTLDIYWTPGANATHLIIQSADGSVRDSVPILPSEATAGRKVVTSLVNSNWKIQIYNNKILRGTTYGIVEGDIILTTGGDLVASLNSATAGQVILLSGTTPYTLGGAEYKFSKDIKIRSTSPVSRSIICLTTSGTTQPTSTANMMSIVSGSILDSLVFENLDISGYADNKPTSIKIGYLFSNKVPCTVTNLIYRNCNIHDYGNTPMRLSAGVTGSSSHIVNLNYSGCLIYESGFSSGYGLVNISKSADFIDNIIINNSTLYDFSYPVITIAQTAATSMNSVIISNCTFNQTTQNVTATRVLFNFDYVNIANGVTIKNCIFGSSGSMTASLKVTDSNTIAPTITGCYYTSDFVDETLVGTPPVSYSIKASMNPYSGTSTSLWNSPTTGDFSLKDTSFKGKGVAGDLRWY
jgi:hypothetical protein